ncbi:hypothetical protein GCM10025873_08960 [Demequina sediminis]|uniref:hypothetical protein n=1 Tax=Demequina sediminis TaxID=1930058 RepID=UPI002573BF3C|nr:hypothetical protein [Demequina sediminis]BDZ61105.1 hypothetical protein GCM10025873_08960 [Demequina sediminis]
MTVTTATTPTNTSLLLKALDRALTAQQPLAAAHVALMRRRRPDATPGQVIASLERQYISSLSASGAAVGATAAVPGVGTATAVALTAGETLTAIEQGVLLALAIAEVHDIRIDDIERRRTLVLAMMLGESGPKLVQKMAGRTGAHLGRKVTNSIPIETIRAINKVLGHNFVTRYGTKQGIVVIGRIAPSGSAPRSAELATASWPGESPREPVPPSVPPLAPGFAPHPHPAGRPPQASRWPSSRRRSPAPRAADSHHCRSRRAPPLNEAGRPRD